MPLLWLWVEGKGERPDKDKGRGGAASLLARRILQERFQKYEWQTDVVKVGHWQNLRKEAPRFVEYLRRRPEVDAVLVLLDLDDGCAAKLAPQLAQTLRELNPPRPIAIVFAVREYEAWFLAAANSLWKKPYEGEPEEPRDARGEVRRLFEPEYEPTTHQPALSAKMSLDEALQNSCSFRRLVHALEELLQAVEQNQSAVTPGFANPDSPIP